MINFITIITFILIIITTTVTIIIIIIVIIIIIITIIIIIAIVPNIIFLVKRYCWLSVGLTYKSVSIILSVIYTVVCVKFIDVFVHFTVNCSRFFINDINKNHPTIEFTIKWAKISTNFLQVTVYITGGIIETDLYNRNWLIC